MKFAMRLTQDNHKLCWGHVVFLTIFGDVIVKNEDIEVLTEQFLAVPYKPFWDAGMNPCQLINGFEDKDAEHFKQVILESFK